MAAIGWVVLNRTTFGRRTFAIGGNAEAARLAGIDVKRHTALLYVLLGLCCGIAAVMIMARTTTGSAPTASSTSWTRSPPSIIGGTLLTGGRGTIVGTVLGVLVFTTITNIFMLNNLTTATQNIAKGLIIVVAVLLQQPGASRAGLTAAAPLTPHHPPPTSSHRQPRTAVRRRSHVPHLTDRSHHRPRPAPFLLGGAALGAGAVARRLHQQRAGRRQRRSSANVAAAGGDNAQPGKQVTIGFSAPAADHGWIAAITKNAQAQAEQYSDVTLKATEGTNDVNQQISQVETLINDEGRRAGDPAVRRQGADRRSALKAMDAGIPVVNLDRDLRHAAGVPHLIGGDNYGMGVAAGTYIAAPMKAKGVANPIIGEIAGIDNLPLTQDRSQGFNDALATYGFTVGHRRPAEFTVESGEQVTANLLQAAPKLDALWNHDDDQGIGVLAAIDQASRSEFFMVGGAGSANAMRDDQGRHSVLKATVTYSPCMSSSAISLAPARRPGQGHGRPGREGDSRRRSRSPRRPSPRRTSTSTCRSASSPDLDPGDPARRSTDEQQGSPTLGVGMVGYAFMGAAHSQAWRTAGPGSSTCRWTRDGGAVRAEPGPDGRGRRGELGWAAVETDWKALVAPGRRAAGRHLHARATATPRSPSRRWRPASTCCARSRWPTPSRRPGHGRGGRRAPGPGRTLDGRLQLPAGARRRARPAAGRRRPARQDPARPRAVPAGLARRPGVPAGLAAADRTRPAPARSATSARTSSTWRSSSPASGSPGSSALTETFVKERPLPGDGLTAGRGPASTVDDAALFLGRFAGGARRHVRGDPVRHRPQERDPDRGQRLGRQSRRSTSRRSTSSEFHDHREDAPTAGFRRILVTEPTHPYLDAWWPPGHTLGYEHTFTHEVKDLVEAVGDGLDPVPSFADGLQVQRVLAAVERSADELALGGVPQ